MWTWAFEQFPRLFAYCDCRGSFILFDHSRVYAAKICVLRSASGGLDTSIFAQTERSTSASDAPFKTIPSIGIPIAQLVGGFVATSRLL